jgi:hypothetical protein
MPLLALPASWVRLVPGYTPSPLLMLLLEQLGQGLGQEEGKQGEEEGGQQQQEQQQQEEEEATVHPSFAATWWEVTLQVLGAAVGAGLDAAEGPAAAAEPEHTCAAPLARDVDRRHLVPSPAALPFWAPLGALARRLVECSEHQLARQQQQQQQQEAVVMQQRVAHLASRLAQAAALARYHPTAISAYAVASRSLANGPWALRQWVDDLALRHTQLQQHVGLYAHLCRCLAPLLPVLDPAVCGQAGVTELLERVLLLEAAATTVQDMCTLLLRTWGVGRGCAAPLADVREVARMAEFLVSGDQHGDLGVQEQEQEPQEQEQQERGAEAAAVAGVSTSPSKQQAPDVAPGGVAASPGTDPIVWMEPGSKVHISLVAPGTMPPSDPEALQEHVAAHGMWVTTQQQYVACRLAVWLLRAGPLCLAWDEAVNDTTCSLLQAVQYRMAQLGVRGAMPSQVEEPEPSDGSRRHKEPPLDPAQVLAASCACFGGLHQAAQQLQALGVGREGQLPGLHGSS